MLRIEGIQRIYGVCDRHGFSFTRVAPKSWEGCQPQVHGEFQLCHRSAARCLHAAPVQERAAVELLLHRMSMKASLQHRAPHRRQSRLRTAGRVDAHELHIPSERTLFRSSEAASHGRLSRQGNDSIICR